MNFDRAPILILGQVYIMTLNLLKKKSVVFWQVNCVWKIQRLIVNAIGRLNRGWENDMPGNIFYIIGVIVVVLFILGYLGLR